jgi:hypothetical protein
MVRGQFEKGHQVNLGRKAVNAGRKRDSVKAALALLIDQGMPEEERLIIVKRLVVRAKKGDVKAAEFLFDRVYGRPTSLSDAELAEARTAAAKEQLKLIRAQTLAQLSQVRYTDIQTEAFKLATITPELFERCLISGLQVPIAILQSISDEERARFLESRAAWQEFVRRVAQKIHIASSEAMAQVYDAAIPAKFEPPREEEEAEEAAS